VYSNVVDEDEHDSAASEPQNGASYVTPVTVCLLETFASGAALLEQAITSLLHRFNTCAGKPLSREALIPEIGALMMAGFDTSR
jgi:hypothetical protein